MKRFGMKKEIMKRSTQYRVQSDGRIKKWAHIQDAGKVLRVILLEDGQTVHNAFFDRSYKES